MDLHARAPGAHVSDCAHVRDVGFPRPGRPGDAGPILPVLQLRVLRSFLGSRICVVICPIFPGWETSVGNLQVTLQFCEGRQARGSRGKSPGGRAVGGAGLW